MRLFVGISLTPKVIDELSVVSARLRAEGDGLRWSAPESWHITLQFLGSATEEQYRCIVAQLRELRSPALPMQLAEMGFFDRAGIFFVGVTLATELLLLQQRVTVATELCGFATESRPFQPHITLARAKGKTSRQSFRQLKMKLPSQPHFTRFLARDFLLYESVPAPAGSRYIIRVRFLLDR